MRVKRQRGDGVRRKERRQAGGRGDAERAQWMGEGLFVHASNSLGVISIACSTIVPLEEEGPKNKNTVENGTLPLCHTGPGGMI